MAEVETGLLLRKSQEAEAIIERIRQEKARTDAEKMRIEEEARQAAELAKKMQEDAQARRLEGWSI